MNLDKSTLGTLFLLIFSVLLGCSSVHEEEAQTAFYINAGKSAESQNVRTFETICKEDQCSFQIHTGPNVEPVKVMLANIDSVYPVSLYLTKAAWPDLRSNGAIVESIISEDMSEEDKAIALWKFVSKRSYHAEPRSEVSHDLHDPVKLLNIFGYGYCGDLNGALVCLAELSGFETRFWVLEGHTVAEMYYDKEWHMFDAVYEVYYYDDSMKIVGVEYLSQYPEVILNSDIDLSYDRLFRKYFNSSASTDEKTELSVHQKYILQNFENLQISFKAEFKVADDEELTFDMMRERMLYNYAKFYTTANDNWIEEGRGANYTTHEMNILLYPKEELIYSFSQLNNEGLKIACYGSRNKCYEGRGSLIRKLSKNRFEQGSEKSEIIYQEKFPYAINAVRIGLTGKTQSSDINVYFSKNKMNWRLLGNLGRIDPANTEIYYDLFDQYPDEFFYEYYIKFEGEMVIDELTEVLAISNDFIFSFLAVPHPSGDSSKYVLHSSWNSSGNTIPEGVKVNLIWTE